jgi:hypothetical protein
LVSVSHFVAHAIVAGLLLGVAPSAIASPLLPKPTVTAFDPGRVRAEIEQLRSVADGIELTLAVCSEQKHCVTAMAPHEVERSIDLIQSRIDHLQRVRDDPGEELSKTHRGFLARYRELQKRYIGYLDRVRQVTRRVAADELDKDWEELLTFAPKEAKKDQGPDVPEANKEVTLDRFNDVNEPLPVQ